MLTLYVVRHGETKWNTERRMQGWQDSPLTEKGKNDARLLHHRLASVPFVAIYSSPSERTKETAKIIRGDRDIPMYFDERLREIHLGDWEGKRIDEIAEIDQQNHYHFYHAPHLYQPLRGETFSDVQQRAIAAIEQMIQQHHEGNLLVVTHGVVIRTLLVYWKQQSIAHLWDSPRVYGTSVTKVRVQPEKFIIELEADISHLKEEVNQ
jgi:broad specificity phosphatase PhoE